MVAPGNRDWGAPNAQNGASTKNNIDESTKLFQKYLENTAPEPRKTNKNSHSRVQGGLPPHLLKLRERTDEHIPSAAPGAKGPEAAPSALDSDSQLSEAAWSSQTSAAAQFSRGPSVQPPRWEEKLRDRQIVVSARNVSPSVDHDEPPPALASEQVYPSIPIRQDKIRHRESLRFMHPALREFAERQMKLAAKRKSMVQSPREVWLANARAGQEDRGAQQEEPMRQTDRTDHHDSKMHKKKWRPNCSEESQSLPSSVVSVKFDSDDDANSFVGSVPGGTKKSSFKDTRGSIANELDIVVKGDGTGWVNKNAWKDYHDALESDDDDSEKKAWMSQYCTDWVASLPSTHPPLVNLLRPEVETHWECDPDPETGALMPPIEYPQTSVNSQDCNTPEELARRMSSTAEIKVTMEAEKLRKRMERREKREEQQGWRYLDSKWKRVNTTHVQQDSPSNPGHSSFGTGQQPDQPITVLGEPQRGDQRKPRILCFLRPVEGADLPQILDIYNWEVEHGRQALDSKPLALRDIQRVFSECEADGTPFIVAVKGTPPVALVSRREATASVHPRGSYQQTRQPGRHNNGTTMPSISLSSDKILGFGLITLPSAGLAGNSHTSVGRFNGQVHFYVEHSSRRFGIGRCILHRLLRCCSKFLVDADWYEWYNPHDSKACAGPGYNTRDYARVFVEMASFKGDPDLKWRKNLLEEMDFLYVNTTDLTRKAIHDAKGGWFDNTVWQHDCGGPGDVHESA
ncbi:hypothetical protein diail_4460 [Diaporthe ilicicola]|nr:hypothetical protein diail_4460 [Diaporthe ilicicola]